MILADTPIWSILTPKVAVCMICAQRVHGAALFELFSTIEVPDFCQLATKMLRASAKWILE